ncbi:Uncharacterized protein TCM_020006 [Theobroma cacao]|uniref:Uncharacterized protein n=1 Tax=Theobroma cacao TaxID=3641 RepID=A0A061EKB7_THECC|nr:Uncharacterized protein TCM_020006 [Theobroma cacao]
MPNTKIIPIIIWNWSDMHPHQDSLKLTDKWEDDYGSGNRHGPDYWHARRAFLKSYHFKEQNGLKDKLKRSMKEINEAAVGVIANYCRELSKRRLGLRVFRVRLGMPSLGLAGQQNQWNLKRIMWLKQY